MREILRRWADVVEDSSGLRVSQWLWLSFLSVGAIGLFFGLVLVLPRWSHRFLPLLVLGGLGLTALLARSNTLATRRFHNQAAMVFYLTIFVVGPLFLFLATLALRVLHR